MTYRKELSSVQSEELLRILMGRFEKNMYRHRDIKWAHILLRIEYNHEKLWSLREMESSGGEPDIIGYDSETDTYIFYDCSKESPIGRRSLCYDLE